MTQLFVCHTQYNLILAIGLSTSSDDLILFKDFKLTDELKRKLEGHFNRCLFLEGNYPKRELKAREKLSRISNDNRILKSFILCYDRIFIVDDMCIQEMYALKCAWQTNRAVEMVWLEDGANAYFSNSNISKGMGSTPIKRWIRKIVFTVKYGLYGFYDLGPCMGAHSLLKSIYVCFPEYVRQELKSKQKVEINNEQLISGMEFMYKEDPFYIENNSILIAMDLLSVYGDSIDCVEREIRKIVAEAKAAGTKVYCKYHPRETEKLPALATAENLDSRIGIESYLINTTAHELTVVGFKSTALQIAKKMNFEVISLVRLIEENSEPITSFYESIGIKCL